MSVRASLTLDSTRLSKRRALTSSSLSIVIVEEGGEGGEGNLHIKV